MSYSFALGGDGWQMVPCMVTFLGEVRDCVAAGLLDVTNLGQIGDARHQAEPTSRHNPAQAPNGQWYVCAADFGGPDYAKLADFHQGLYRAHDPRVYNHGFTQWGDGYGLSWYDGGREWTGRDQGHCHFDVTMAFPQLSAQWWVDSLASTAPWGLADFLRTGHTTSGGNATPIEEDDSMSAADVQALKDWLWQQFEAREKEDRATERADMLQQAVAAIRAEVTPDIEALTTALQTTRADLGGLSNALKNANVIPHTPAATPPATPQV